MLRYALFVFYLASLFGAAACVLVGIYSVIEMRSEARIGKIPLLLLGPFILILPQLFNDRGNRARKRLVLSSLLFFVLFGVCKLLLSIPLQ